MSSLNSYARHIRQRAFGDRPTTHELHVTGVDIELLEAAYDIVRRELNFFPGNVFTTIEHSLQEFCQRDSKSLLADWVSGFARAAEFNQVIMVARSDIQKAEGGLVWTDPETPLIIPPVYFAEVYVLLSKSGEWLVWTNYPNSRFEVCETPRSAVETAYAILQPGERFGMIESLSVEIGRMLAYTYRRHVEQRESRLERSRGNLAKLEFLTGNLL